MHVLVAYVFYFMAPEDIQFQVQMQGTFFAAAMALAVCITLAKVRERGSNPNPNPNPIPNPDPNPSPNPNPKQVKERPMTELQRSTSKPVVPSMRDMLANKPYMMYLLFNVPFKLAALIPINVIIDYLKFNAKVLPLLLHHHHPPHPSNPA